MERTITHSFVTFVPFADFVSVFLYQQR